MKDEERPASERRREPFGILALSFFRHSAFVIRHFPLPAGGAQAFLPAQLFLNHEQRRIQNAGHI
jgi:hypothetical protein